MGKFFKFLLTGLSILLFVSIYIPLPNGTMFLLTLAGIFLTLGTMNAPSRGLALMLFSGNFFGNIFTLWNINFPAYILCVLIGFFHVRRYYRSFLHEQAIIITFVILLLFFGFTFLIGPMHAYSQQKILYITVIGSVSLLAWTVSIQSPDIELDKQAQYLLFISLGYISIAYEFYDFRRPASPLDFNFFRESFTFVTRKLEESMNFTYQTVGISAMYAVAFIIGKVRPRLGKSPLLLITLLLSVGIILIAQARQAIFGFLILLLARIMLDMRTKSYIKMFRLIVLACFAVFLLTNVKSDVMEKSLHATNSTDFFNRDYENVGDAVSNRSIFFGTGLGGYSQNGQRAYPHNIALEIYYETGILGVIFISGLLLFSLFTRQSPFNRITRSEFYILIPVTGFFVKAIISSDLTENIAFLTALIVILNIKRTHPNTISQNESNLFRKR